MNLKLLVAFIACALGAADEAKVEQAIGLLKVALKPGFSADLDSLPYQQVIAM
jgi:hypothetical protein